MKLAYRLILIAFIIFVGSIILWALFLPKEDVSQRIYRTLKEQEKKADLSFKEVTFEEVLAGKKYWQLAAQSAMINKSTQVATLKNVNGSFFKDNQAALRFKSPAALWDMKNKEILLDQPLGYDISLEDKIQSLIKQQQSRSSSIFTLPALASADPGYWFLAKNLSWNLANQQLLCTGNIILKKGGLTGQAQTLKSDIGMEKIFLSGNPIIMINTNKQAPATLEAETFEVLRKNNLINATGNPRLIWTDAIINADKFIYQQKDKQLQLVGNVKVTYQDIKASSQTAIYSAVKNNIVLEGNARARQADNKLSGNKVSVSLKDKKIKLLGKGKVVISE